MHGDPLFLGTRSEVVVAADAVWSLFHANILPADPLNIRRAADAAGIPVQALKDAQARRRDRIYTPPRAEYRARTETSAPPPPPRPSAPRFRTAATKAAHQAGSERGAAAAAAKVSRQPAPDAETMKCSACRKTKPVDEFSLRSDRPGKRWTACIPCRRAAQHARYLSVEKRQALDRARLEFIWSDVDDELGLACSGCGNRFVVGERVAGDAVVTHVRCPS